MSGLSNVALARALGISEAAVRKAERTGRIVREADGGWDLERVQGQLARNTDAAQQRGERPGRPKAVPNAAVEATRSTLAEHGLAAPASAEGMTFMQARTANEVLKAQERRLRVQRLTGALVDRSMAAAEVFRLARQERDAWTTWPSRVAAIMAAELGVDEGRLHACLETHVREHLAELAEPRLDLK